MTLDARDEWIAVKLNRVFAAARMLRGSRPAGYESSCRELAALRSDLEADLSRLQRIEDRVLELSGGTFHWEP
jgi:hypothetical protein